LKVSVLALVVGLGPKDVVTPLGTPLVKSLTLAVKPPVGFIAMVVVPLADNGMVTLVGDADRVKSGEAELTVNVTVVECIRPPPEPVTVIG
jgi:hypothetical protein